MRRGGLGGGSPGAPPGSRARPAPRLGVRPGVAIRGGAGGWTCGAAARPSGGTTWARWGSGGASVGRRPATASMGWTPRKGSVSPAWSTVAVGGQPASPVVKAASAVPQTCCPSGVRTISRPSLRLRTRSWSWTRPWSVSQSSTRLASVGASAVEPVPHVMGVQAFDAGLRAAGAGAAAVAAQQGPALGLGGAAPAAADGEGFAALLEHDHGGGLAEHAAGLGAGDARGRLRSGRGRPRCPRRARRRRRAPPPRGGAGHRRRRSMVTRASASAPRAAMRRAAVRSRARPTAASSAQRSATARSTRPPAARICLVPGLRPSCSARVPGGRRVRRGSRSATSSAAPVSAGIRILSVR